MFKNKKWIGTVVITLLTLLLLAVSGKAVYRLGYKHGIGSAQSDVMPAAMRLGEHGLHDRKIVSIRPGGPGHEGLSSQHGFQKRDGQQGHQQMFAGHDGGAGKQSASHGGNSAGGGFGHGWRAGGLGQLLFIATMLAVFVYVIVKVFQPGGWQLSFGPRQPTEADTVEDKNPVTKPKKATVKKVK